jgi:hypothetical protein
MVSYFSPYKTSENTVTNAVLLLLSHIHRTAPEIFEAFLKDIAGEDIAVGPIFANQDAKSGGKSVVDAIIRQTPIEINIETKITHGDSLDTDQLKRHAEGMKREARSTRRVLLGLTPSPLSPQMKREAASICDKCDVAFTHRTFAQIASYFEEAVPEFHEDLNAILSDFRVYLSNNNQLPPSQNRMIVNPCGNSLESNRATGIYHDQPWRSKVPSKYLGCYDDKAVRLVGEVHAVFIAEVADGELVIHEQFDLPWQDKRYQITEKDRTKVLGLIESSPYADLGVKPDRFYLTNGFRETEFEKVSKYGIQGHRYFDLDGEDGVLTSLFEKNSSPNIKAVALALSDKTWS